MGFPGTTVRVRQDVWNLSDQDVWHPTILWYARAVKALKAITDVTNPKGWPYLARIHGTGSDPSTWPNGVDDWNSCQHGSWYFLPWHRMYLHYFEQIVRKIIVDLNGPVTWALPYWDYSADPARSDTLALPEAFRSSSWPDPGPNPLRETLRADGMNDGDPLPVDDVALNGWTVSYSTDILTRPSFGGPITGWHHPPSGAGALERSPHGTVHSDIGGPGGLMSAFDTAPLDPIFWLHHCNIDRLWEVWRNLANTELPTVTPWLDFTFPIGTGPGRVVFAVTDVRHTTMAPLFYRYDGVPVPPIPAPGAPGPAGGPIAEEPMEPTLPPRQVGATDDPVMVGAQEGRATIAIKPEMPGAGGPGPAGGGVVPRLHTYLTLENITASGPTAGVYVVTVRPPEGAGPDPARDREVGRFSTFGLAEASLPDGEHAGSGLAFTFDVTEIVSDLGLVADAADEPKLNVAVVPARPVQGNADGGELSIGKIGVYQE